MEESTTYQEILHKGEARGVAKERAASKLRESLLIEGIPRWGVPDTQAREALDAIGDVSRLQELVARVPAANSWQDLLGLKKPQRGRGRKATP